MIDRKRDSHNHTRMIEEQIKRTADESPFIQNATIYVEDHE